MENLAHARWPGPAPEPKSIALLSFPSLDITYGIAYKSLMVPGNAVHSDWLQGRIIMVDGHSGGKMFSSWQPGSRATVPEIKVRDQKPTPRSDLFDSPKHSHHCALLIPWLVSKLIRETVQLNHSTQPDSTGEALCRCDSRHSQPTLRQ